VQHQKGKRLWIVLVLLLQKDLQLLMIQTILMVVVLLIPLQLLQTKTY
jgi:hypothetical protein